MRSLAFFVTIILVTGCSPYKTHFDCPPKKGVGCKSVTEIEKMVVETPKGQEDLFIPDADSKKGSTCTSCKKGKTNLQTGVDQNRRFFDGKEHKNGAFINEHGEIITKKPEIVGRVWISGFSTPNGHYVDGQHVYFTITEDQWLVGKESTMKGRKEK